MPARLRERLVETVAALRDPTSYPGAVAKVEAIETHMSWVFLTETRAYKLKKPICTALIDHSSVPARRRACVAELALNRRLARSVYLAVVPVVRRDAGPVPTFEVGGAGEPVDWLVKMRRLPEHQMLDACIREGTVTGPKIDRLGDILADFFAGAMRVEFDGTRYRARITADIAEKRGSLAQPHYGLSSEEIDAAYAAQQQWLARHAALLDARGASVVDGHGDLRPEHVCLEQPPVVIDCLEFSTDLRRLDPVSELSFLALECRRLNAEWIGDRLLRRYAARTGDRAPAELVAFYQSQHALIRAAIAVWHLDDEAVDHADRWRARAREYLGLACAVLA